MTIEEIDRLQKAYEAKAKPETEYLGSSSLFFSWYNEAKAFFKINIDNNDDDYKAFAHARPYGNEYVLHSFYQELSGLYSALKALYKSNKANKNKMKGNNVFIVHGHNINLLGEVENLLYQLGLCPIVLNQQANKGLTLLKKLEKYTDVEYAIVLYTPCDKGKDIQYKGRYRMRARQNVVFEHGYLIAKLGESNVAMLKQGDVEIPSDVSGVVYVESEEWRYKLADEMQKAGLPVDKNKIR